MEKDITENPGELVGCKIAEAWIEQIPYGESVVLLMDDGAKYEIQAGSSRSEGTITLVRIS